MRKLGIILCTIFLLSLIGCGNSNVKEQILVMECKKCKIISEEVASEKESENVILEVDISELNIGNGVGFCSKCWENEIKTTLENNTKKQIEEKKKQEDAKKEEERKKAEEKKKEIENINYVKCYFCGKTEDSRKIGQFRKFGPAHKSCINKIKSCKKCGSLFGYDVFNDNNKNGICGDRCDTLDDLGEIKAICANCGAKTDDPNAVGMDFCAACGVGPMVKP